MSNRQSTSSSLDNPSQRIVDTLKEMQESGWTDEEQHTYIADIKEDLTNLHEADIADLLEILPIVSREIIWPLIPKIMLGPILLEVGDHLCEQLVEMTETETMISILKQMDGDDVAALMRELPKNDAARLMRLAGLANNTNVRASLSFADDTVGALMDFQPVLAYENETVKVIRDRLQEVKELPSHCDKLFVVDDWDRLAGVLPLKRLLLNQPHSLAHEIMVSKNVHTFQPDDHLTDNVVGAFERYNLITAPVLDDKHKVVGRITIDEIFDYVHSNKEKKLLNSAGVKKEEDLFASIPKRFNNRWVWLFINLIAALLISRVIGLFEATIVQLVALAALMPIVAGISGNIGNQTATLTVRALALNQINTHNWRNIMLKEGILSIVNGFVWGSFVATFAYLFYDRADLSIVLLISMIFCALFSALSGFVVPLLMQRMKRDPALGTTVIISVLVDTLSFFVFLGLGALFLV